MSVHPAWRSRDGLLAALSAVPVTADLPDAVRLLPGLPVAPAALDTLWGTVRSACGDAAAQTFARTVLVELLLLGLSHVGAAGVAGAAKHLAESGAASVAAFAQVARANDLGADVLARCGCPPMLLAGVLRVNGSFTRGDDEPVDVALERLGVAPLGALRPDQACLSAMRKAQAARKCALPFFEARTFPWVPAARWRHTAAEGAALDVPDGYVVALSARPSPKLVPLPLHAFLAAVGRLVATVAATGRLGDARSPPTRYIHGYVDVLWSMGLTHTQAVVQAYDERVRRDLAGPPDLLATNPATNNPYAHALLELLPSVLLAVREELHETKATPAPTPVDPSPGPPNPRAASRRQRQREARAAAQLTAAAKRKAAQEAAERDAKRAKLAAAAAAHPQA
eukprot:TRINITY_DN363_c0_g2_i2.p2 TRINITY_DN363_c0_g2~~TRINITY_DN363_c0_g2_i2.p2  ORF type:complete len:397 (+),score=92.29 TRINITY_DN363_c0_g2_i2:68-1258(+)